MTDLTEPFAERVRRLFEELELAIRWERPAILLAVYRSFFVVLEAEKLLTLWLSPLGQKVELYLVTPQNADIPFHLSRRSAEERAGTVFFIIDLGKGGEESLRALNIRREYFVDYGLRVVFWVNKEEARQIAWAATDFWRFRHRVIEFPEEPAPERAMEWVRGEIQLAAPFDRTEDIEAKIALREKLLADLPPEETTLAARGDLLFSLGNLYSLRYDATSLQKAEECFHEAKGLFARIGNMQRLAPVLLGLGRVYSRLGRREEALEATKEAAGLYRKLAQENPQAFLPDLATSLNNLGNRLSEVGRREEALEATKEAAGLYRKLAQENPQAFLPDLATSLNNLGNRLSEVGRREEALEAYEEAVRTLLPFYRRLPAAFAAWMDTARRNYQEMCKQLGRKPKL